MAMPFVLQSITVLTVATFAIRTLKRLLSGMRANVHPQIVTLATPFRTHRALEITHVPMLRHVRSVIVPRLESFTAYFTRIRPQIIMHPLHVNIQLKLIREHFTTYLAAEPFRVLLLMHLQLERRVARELAQIAAHAFLRHVRYEVLAGVQLPAEFFAANGALEFARLQTDNRVFGGRLLAAQLVRATYVAD